VKSFLVFGLILVGIGVIVLFFTLTQEYIPDEEYLSYLDEGTFPPHPSFNQREFNLISGSSSLVAGFVVIFFLLGVSFKKISFS